MVYHFWKLLWLLFYTLCATLCEFCFGLIKHLLGCDRQNKSHYRVIAKWLGDLTAHSGTCWFESRQSFNMAYNINSLKNGIPCKLITVEVIRNMKSKYITSVAHATTFLEMWPGGSKQNMHSPIWNTMMSCSTFGNLSLYKLNEIYSISPKAISLILINSAALIQRYIWKVFV